MAASPALTAILGDVLWCLGLGCLLGACRDLTGLLLGEGPVRCFVWDVAAFAAAAVLLYGFCAGVSASGVARWYMAGAMLVGALAWERGFPASAPPGGGVVRQVSALAVPDAPRQTAASAAAAGQGGAEPAAAEASCKKNAEKGRKAKKAVAKAVENII